MKRSFNFWVETFSFYQKNETSSRFVKPFGLASGAFVRGTVDLFLGRKGFNSFNFYSINNSIDLVKVDQVRFRTN